MLWHQGKSKIKRSKRSYLAPTSLSIDNFFILFLCDISTHLVRALFRLFVIFVGIRGGSSPFSPLPLRLVLPCLLPLRHVSSSFFSFFFATEKLHCRSTSTNQPRSAWSLSSGRVPTPASAPFTVLRWISNQDLFKPDMLSSTLLHSFAPPYHCVLQPPTVPSMPPSSSSNHPSCCQKLSRGLPLPRPLLKLLLIGLYLCYFCFYCIFLLLVFYNFFFPTVVFCGLLSPSSLAFRSSSGDFCNKICVGTSILFSLCIGL